MSHDDQDFVDLCEVIGSLAVPIFFFQGLYYIATAIPVEPSVQAVILIWFVYCALRLGPHIGGIIGVLILMFENQKKV
jgi:hypothetical protein